MGRSADNDLSVDDPSLSRHHLRVEVDGDRAAVSDCATTNGTRLEGRRITAPAELHPDEVIGAGLSLLSWAIPPEATSPLVPTADGAWAFNRPPCLAEPPARARIEFPEPPRPPERNSLPMAAAVLPAAMGVGMAVMMHRPTYALFSVLSPIMLGVTAWGERRRTGRAGRAQADAHRQGTQIALRALADAAARDRDTQRRAHPDPGFAADVAVNRRPRLWERRADHDDSLVLRVGTADRPARVEVAGGPGAPRPPRLASVPVTASLRRCGGLGVAGPDRARRSLARWLVVQLAVWHSPRHLHLVLLAGAGGEADWGWVRWLPHLRPDGSTRGAPRLLVGTDPDLISQRVAELAQLLEARRREAQRLGGGGGAVRFDDVVVVLDGARALRSDPAVSAVLRDGPAHQIYNVCLERNDLDLPLECGAVATFADDACTLTLAAAGGERTTVLADQVSAAYAERVARALAPLRDATADPGSAGLPDSARLLELLDLDPPGADELVRRWTSRPASTSCPIGVAADGTFMIDLAADGPHALVAGTTGAGKSELLQTLVASLAVANRPDAVCFVLIDYKGGSAFADCARLAHTVGMVTDLDGHLTERALTSLGAELHRREQLLRRPLARTSTTTWRPPPRPAGAAWPGWCWWWTSSPRWPRSCPTSCGAWSASPSGAGPWGCTWCWPPSGPAGWCHRRSGPTPTCASRCG